MANKIFYSYKAVAQESVYKNSMLFLKTASYVVWTLDTMIFF